ncbi:MAG: acetate--CoA ligase family protein [Candidatus Bipolaricaulaceae bacterium]
MTGETADLRPLLAPRAIAVVGASQRSGPGRQVMDNLRQLGFPGEVIPVNPKYEQVLGYPCFPSLSAAVAAGRRPELMALLLGREQVVPVVEEGARLGIRAAWAFASGFAEADGRGRALQAELAALCSQAGVALMGPNCVGFVNPAAATGAYSAPLSPRLAPGRVGAVAQSGSVCLALANAARGLGFSLLVSSGNEAVVDVTDYMAYMLDDPGTDVVLAFVEQFRRPDRFVEVARRARELEKPIVVLKVGRSEVARRAAAAHTGALAGSDAVHDAVFDKYGVIRVDDLDEMLETAVALTSLRGRLPRGDRVGVITVSGGEIGLVADLARGLCLSFPPWDGATAARLQAALPPYAEVANPLDAWGSGKIEETYPPCVTAAAEDPNVDALLITLDVPPGLAPAQVDQYRVVAESAVATARTAAKPIVVLSNLAGGLHAQLRGVLEDGGLPLLQGTRAGLRAVDRLIWYGTRPRPAAAPPAPAPPAGVAELLDRRGPLTEHASKRVLAAYGIRCTRERLCRSPEQAVAAAHALGYPVALKVMSPRLLHKTDAGLVRLGLGDDRGVAEAYTDLWERARGLTDVADLEGILVQEMAPRPVAEVIVGALRDEGFGPVVVFGAGGELVELIEDRALALPPLTRAEAEAMLSCTRVGRLLSGFRGRPSGDGAALVDVLVQVGELARQWADRIRSIDVNPLFVLPAGQGVVAVDALIELMESEDGKGADA